MEVTFVGAGEPFVVRLVDNHANTILRAAENLKARFVVLMDDYFHEGDVPIWSVFDVKGASKMMGEYVLPLAVKKFKAETSDGAVMWAVAKLGVK